MSQADRMQLAVQRPTTERLEPGTSHIDVSPRSPTWPTYCENFDSHRPLHFSLSGVSLLALGRARAYCLVPRSPYGTTRWLTKRTYRSS
jgi:hypothetical protein